MNSYALTLVPDHVLLRDLAALVTQDRATTAAVLAHLAEVDERRLYLPAAYPSMFAWCVGELRLSEDAAFRRIRAARIARQFPAILPALADGRLNLSAVLLLAPCLSAETSEELLVAAAHKTKPELERLLAQRFPQPDVTTLVQAIPAATQVRGAGAGACQLAPAPLGMTTPEHGERRHGESALQLAPGRDAPASRAAIAALAPERFALQVTIGQETHDKLRYAQALLGHAMASGDVAQVLDRARDALIGRLEQRKFAASSQTRACERRRGASNTRHVPAAIRREVWQRDAGQCTFRSENGHRCASRTRLEFDHVVPVARGGTSNTANLRLRCRAHNQFAAERTFGRGFMDTKRGRERRRVANVHQGAAAAVAARSSGASVTAPPGFGHA